MKKATTKNTAKATAKASAKATSKSAAKKTEPAKTSKLNKLELAYAEKQLSRAEYDMWMTVYQKEVPFNENIIEEEDYRPRKTRRSAW